MKRKQQKPFQLTRSVLDSLVPDSAPLYTLLSCRADLAERLAEEGCPTMPLLLPRQVPPGLARVAALDKMLPVLLDTVQLPLPQLVDVLLLLRSTEHPAVALVDLSDRRTQRLLMLCPAVETILADREEQIWAGLAEPRLPLITLDLLHALPRVTQLRQVADASGLSRLAIFQGISDLETMLGVTLGRANTAPALLYERIVAWLAAPHRPRPQTPHDPATLPHYQITKDGWLRAPALAGSEPLQPADAALCWRDLHQEQQQEQVRIARERQERTAHERQERLAAKQQEQQRQAATREAQRAKRLAAKQQEQVCIARERQERTAREHQERRAAKQQEQARRAAVRTLQRQEARHTAANQAHQQPAQQTEAQRQEHNRIARASYQRRRAQMSTEQRQEQIRKQRGYAAHRHAQMTEEQRQEQRRHKREYTAQRRAQMTEEQRQEQRRVWREHYHQRRTKQSQQERTDDY